MNLASLLEESAKKHPYKIISFSDSRNLTYRQLNSRANQFAAYLKEKNNGDTRKRIAILLHNSDFYLIALFAAAKANMISVPVNSFLKADEVSYILNDSEVDILLSSSDFLPLIEDIKEKADTIDEIIITDKKIEGCLYFRDLLKHQPASNLADDIKETELALFSYTSSTTGSPKAAMLTHKNIISNVISCSKVIKVGPGDRFLLALPLFHTFTLTVCAFLPVYSGAAVVMVDSIKPFSRLIKRVILKRVSILVGIPQFYRVMNQVKLPWYLSLFLKINPLRLAVSGAAPLDRNDAAEFEKKYKVKLREGYGLTEASPVVSINPPDGVNKPGSVGLPLPDIEVKVVDVEENELPPDEVGELIIRGPNVMRGYYNMPEEAGQVMRGGWLFSGDLAKLDEDSYIYIVDRKKDVIISHGMNIYPREVEETITLHPKVEEVAVIGRPDKFKGEVPVAIIVPKANETVEPREIIDYCKSRLANFKIPHIIETRSELPKTPTGKILKRVLRQEYKS